MTFKAVEVAIANGASEPAAGIPMAGYRLAAIYLPASVTGTTITFSASPTLGGTYVGISDSANSPVSWTRTTDAAVCLVNTPGSEYVPPVPYLKPAFGAQTGAITVTLFLEKV